MSTFVIADDSRPTRLFLKSALMAAGHEVLADVGDGAEAVKACAWHHPDFLLTDVTMPVIPGDIVAERVVRDRLAGHVIILTSVPNPQITDKLRAIGVTIWSKPICDKPVLIQRLAPLLPPAHPSP